MSGWELAFVLCATGLCGVVIGFVLGLVFP